MKRGMVKADKTADRKTGNGLAKTLLKIVGIGLAAGAALVAVTDKTMKKAFPEEKEEEALDNGCGGSYQDGEPEEREEK